jgi:hypothetical protein
MRAETGDDGGLFECKNCAHHPPRLSHSSRHGGHRQCLETSVDVVRTGLPK